MDGHIPGELRAHYFSTEDSAVAEVGDAGLTVVDVRGMDGPAPSVGQRNLMRAPRAIVQQWGEIAYHVGGIRDYRSASTHLLLTVQKPTETRK